jgi:hypothetical protein
MAASDSNRTRADGVSVTKLPELRRALERRYPGVTVSWCEFRKYPGDHEDHPGVEGLTICFTGRWEDLIAHGLALSPRSKRSDPIDEFGTARPGADFGDESSYVIHHTYDGDPIVSRGHTFPSRTLETQVERLWRRVVKLPRQIATRP